MLATIGDERSTLLRANLEVTQNTVAGGRVDHWSHGDGIVFVGWADLHNSGRTSESFDQGITRSIDSNGHTACHAALAGATEGCTHDCTCGEIEFGVRHHNHEIFCASCGLNTFAASRSEFVNVLGHSG